MRLFVVIFIAIGLHPFSLEAKTRNKIQERAELYLSPTYMCADKAMNKFYVSLSTAGGIAVVDAGARQLEKTISVPFDPGGIAFSNRLKALVVADKEPEGAVYVLSPESGKIQHRFQVGHTPDALVVTTDGERVFVANRFSHTV